MKAKKTDQRFEVLRNKLEKRDKNAKDTLWHNHAPALCYLTENFPGKQLAAGALGGLLLLTSPNLPLIPLTNLISLGEKQLTKTGKEIVLREELAFKVPNVSRPLSVGEEDQIAATLSQYFGISVKPEIDNRRLDRTYGIIGGEQHLYRYPGDQLYKHADSAFAWSTFGKYGIAPGLGAWGYFAPSARDFTGLDALREKYYVAVQTFLAPGFEKDVSGFRDFFKYRKMLVVNPKNGQAVVADIADAGPSPWTGKQLGGSPEVMYSLGLMGGKGAVLYFFIDDPAGNIPLGPIAP